MRRKRILFYNYFEDWINIYKVGAVSERTIDKYWLAHRHLKKACSRFRIRPNYKNWVSKNY